MFHYYVYYRVDPRHAVEAEAAVNQLQFEIEAATGVRGRLLTKRDEPHLWMEVYENVPGETFEARLARATERAGVARFLQAGSTRRIECFQG